MRIVRGLLAVIGLSLAGYLLLRFVVVTDTQRVARVLEKTRQGIVRHDIHLTMSGFDRSYRDDFGHDYAGLDRWFEHWFQSYDSLVCVFPRLVVLVQHREATCTLSFWAAGLTKGTRQTDLDQEFPLYSDQVVVSLHKYDTGWRIVGASP